MNAKDSRRLETEVLIEAIWGPSSSEPVPPIDLTLRRQQNAALAAALRAYLQQYLAEQ